MNNLGGYDHKFIWVSHGSTISVSSSNSEPRVYYKKFPQVAEITYYIGEGNILFGIDEYYEKLQQFVTIPVKDNRTGYLLPNPNPGIIPDQIDPNQLFDKTLPKTNELPEYWTYDEWNKFYLGTLYSGPDKKKHAVPTHIYHDDNNRFAIRPIIYSASDNDTDLYIIHTHNGHRVQTKNYGRRMYANIMGLWYMGPKNNQWKIEKLITITDIINMTKVKGFITQFDIYNLIMKEVNNKSITDPITISFFSCQDPYEKYYINTINNLTNIKEYNDKLTNFYKNYYIDDFNFNVISDEEDISIELSYFTVKWGNIYTNIDASKNRMDLEYDFTTSKFNNGSEIIKIGIDIMNVYNDEDSNPIFPTDKYKDENQKYTDLNILTFWGFYMKDLTKEENVCLTTENLHIFRIINTLILYAKNVRYGPRVYYGEPKVEIAALRIPFNKKNFERYINKFTGNDNNILFIKLIIDQNKSYTTSVLYSDINGITHKFIVDLSFFSIVDVTSNIFELDNYIHHLLINKHITYFEIITVVDNNNDNLQIIGNSMGTYDDVVNDYGQVTLIKGSDNDEKDITLKGGRKINRKTIKYKGGKGKRPKQRKSKKISNKRKQTNIKKIRTNRKSR